MSEKHIGKVIQVIGPVLDIQFKDGELPDLLNAIEIDNHGQKLVVEVAQLTGDNVARCIAMSSTGPMTWITLPMCFSDIGYNSFFRFLRLPRSR